MRGRNLRPHQHAARNPCRFLRDPFSSRPPAPRGLLFGQHDRAVRLAGFAQIHRHRVRRINFEKMINASRKRCAGQPVTQQLRRQNIRHAFDVIAGRGVALHPHAQLAQLFDPAPDLLPRHANFLGDLRRR